MMALIEKIHSMSQEHQVTKQLVKFCLVGVINTSIDFTIYLLITRLTVFWGNHLVAASAVSYLCGGVSSFLLNNFWTFRQSKNGALKRIPPFALINLTGMGWNALLVFIMLSLGMFDVIAKAVATICVVAWNFTLQKKIAFKA